jgi:gentisate 1,2-dioxygenase
LRVRRFNCGIRVEAEKYRRLLGNGGERGLSRATSIDGVRYDCSTGDTLSVPVWRAHRHENRSVQPAVLFVMNNQLLRALGYYREKAAP